MKLTKEIKAAIIVIAGIVCFILGFNFLNLNHCLAVTMYII